mgnify:CR=1 FL=1
MSKVRKTFSIRTLKAPFILEVKGYDVVLPGWEEFYFFLYWGCRNRETSPQWVLCEVTSGAWICEEKKKEDVIKQALDILERNGREKFILAKDKTAADFNLIRQGHQGGGVVPLPGVGS